jgi:Zn finger protein HypA/HybF involved in hydrogenase expression
MNPDGTPHKTNTRNKLDEFVLDNGDIEKEVWFGWEQEYTLTTKSFYPFGDGEGLPLGFTGDWSKPPRPQGDYYCGIGSDTVVGRKIVEEHMEKCLEIGSTPETYMLSVSLEKMYKGVCPTCGHELISYKKKTACDRCGFKSEDTNQLDVYHVDSDVSNCKYENLKTVCANCQRLLHKLKLPWKRGDLTPDF